MFKRSSGVLLHPTSLPSPFGVGDLGPEAYRFADFLARSGQSILQVLPLGPPATAILRISVFRHLPAIPSSLAQRSWCRWACCLPPTSNPFPHFPPMPLIMTG
jgi:hypothetical protein